MELIRIVWKMGVPKNSWCIIRIHVDFHVHMAILEVIPPFSDAPNWAATMAHPTDRK